MTTLAQEFGLTAHQAQAIANQGFDLMEAGDLDAAQTVFTGLLLLNPLDSSMHAALGAVLHQQGQTDAAERSYDRAIELDGRAVLALVNRGELRLKRGDATGVRDLQAAAALESPLKQRAQQGLKISLLTPAK